MPRRKPYTRFKKREQIREDHVKGMGDVVFRGFQCLNSKCTHFIFIREDEIDDDFEIECPICGFQLRSGDETKFYEYDLIDLRNKNIIESGEFTVLHDDYIEESSRYKYCIICNTLKPLDAFSSHGSRKSGRQGECKICKTIYNSIKNQTRLTDQHREAAQKRRLYLDLSGGKKINSKKIFEHYEYKCFKCGKDLKNVPNKDKPIDHTLPAQYLWPLTSDNATLLCREHNGEKSGKWPSEYYSEDEIKKLSILTGIKYEVLKGEPHFNPEAIEQLSTPEEIDQILHKYSRYMNEIAKLRNRILATEGIDIFAISKSISKTWITFADKMRK